MLSPTDTKLFIQMQLTDNMYHSKHIVDVQNATVDQVIILVVIEIGWIMDYI